MSETATEDDSLEEQHALALIALLNSLDAAPFDVDNIPKADDDRPDMYNEVTVARKHSESDYMLSGEQTLTAHRFSTRAVAKRLTNARMMRGRAARLEGRTVVIGGIESTPIEFVTEQDLFEDEGWYSGRTEWSYEL